MLNSYTKFWQRHMKSQKTGGEYIGLTLKWDCKNKEIHLFMAGYIQRALTWFHQKQPRKLQHQQYPHFPPNYGLWIQYAKLSNTVLLLELKQTKFIVDVAMTFLYYSQAVDSMMLITLSAFVVEQAKQTTTTKQQTKQFLDYATTNSKATIKCLASSMVLAVHSNASYLSEKTEQGGIFSYHTTPPFPLTMMQSIIQNK